MKVPSAIGVLTGLVLSACATPYANQPPPPQFLPASFRPVDPKKFKTEQASQDAVAIAYQTCRAQALQAGAGVPMPPPFSGGPPQTSASATVNIGNRPDYSIFANSPDISQSYEAGYRLGQAQRAQANAERARAELEQSTFLSCMGQNGWVLKMIYG